MSYILDALKRADTERERERGNVPGLHSQNLPSGSFHRDRQRRRQSPKLPRYSLWAGLLALALVVGWFFWHTAERHPEVASTPAMTPDPAPPPDTRTPADTSAVPAVPTEPLAAQAPDLPILAPPPPAPPPVRAERPPSSERAGATAAAAPSKADAPAANNGEAPPPSTPVRRFAELSQELRAQLPQISVNGSTFSSNPKLRTLIANGKVFQEGDEIAPGLQLETIGQRSAVLNFNGTRYSIGF